MAVVTYHASRLLSGPQDYGHAPFAGMFTFGRAGVDFFFVLSGFIIAYVHARDVGHKAGFAPFWMKRLQRVYPVYWLATAAFLALLFYSPTRDLAERNLGHVAASLLLLPESVEPVLGVGWSLRHEMLFYGVFGVLLLSRGLGVALLTTWASLIAFNAAWSLSFGTAYFVSPLGVLVARIFNSQFFLGMAVAWLIRTTPAWRPGLVLAAGVALFLATGLFEDYGPRIPHEWPPLHLAYGIGAAATLYGLAALDLAGRIRLPGWIVGLGTASYSIYLFQVPIMLPVQGVLRAIRPWLALPAELAWLVMVAAAVIGAVVISRLVEQPLLRLTRRLGAARVPPLPSSRTA